MDAFLDEFGEIQSLVGRLEESAPTAETKDAAGAVLEFINSFVGIVEGASGGDPEEVFAAIFVAVFLIGRHKLLRMLVGFCGSMVLWSVGLRVLV